MKKPQEIDDDNDDYDGGYDENFRVDDQIFTPLLLPFFFWILYYSQQVVICKLILNFEIGTQNFKNIFQLY